MANLGLLKPCKSLIVVHVAAGRMRRWPLMDMLGPRSDFMGQRTSAEVIRKWNARATRLGLVGKEIWIFIIG